MSKPEAKQRVASLISAFNADPLRDDLRRHLSKSLMELSDQLEIASKTILVASAADMLEMVARIEGVLREFKLAVVSLQSLGFARSKTKSISRNK